MLNDPLNNVQISTEWLKTPGGDNGGSWAARIKGRPLSPSMQHHELCIWSIIANAVTANIVDGLPTPKTSVIFYFGMDGLGSLDLENEEDDDVRATSSLI